ncbi:ABC transporter permease [Vallitalea pronyensis]|nr:ABC transporter permease subunit [Vallitalea pronyensis]
MKKNLHDIMKHKWLYAFLLPSILILFIFKYLPMLGNIIAFKDYSINTGIIDSPWVGLKHFKYLLFESSEFWGVFKNTIIITFYRIIVGFPAPIILALLLNEIRLIRAKKVAQTIVYLPHFISWVVIAGIFQFLLTVNGGPVNTVLGMFGAEPIPFLQSKEWFRGILVGSSLFKEAGYGTVIYMAALTGIDQQLYEAAKIDGANRWKCLLKITIPGIMPTAVIVLIISVGSTIRTGFEQVLLFISSPVFEVGDILQTYVYRTGLQMGRFSYASAIGMFESIIALVLILTTNKIAKSMREEGGLW